MKFTQATILAAVAYFASAAPAGCTPTSVNLGDANGNDSRNNFDSVVTADVYACSNAAKQPLVVMATGGTLRKGDYSAFATELSERHHTVMIIDHPVNFGPPPALNIATPVDIENAIAWASGADDLNVNMDEVVAFGHSFGGSVILNALNNECVFPWCGSPFGNLPVTLSENVAAAFVYGFSLRDRTGFLVNNLDNNNFKFAIINGDGDTGAFDSDNTGEPLFEGTFSRLAPAKASAVASNLDHYSLADIVVDNRGDQLSTRPRAEQNTIVVDLVAEHIKRSLNKDDPKNACERLEKLAEDRNFDITKCLVEET